MTAYAPLPAAPHALPLARLLDETADVVMAVRGGRSLSDLLPRVAADARPGVQALAFEVLRNLGAALELRRLLAPKEPPPRIDALLVSALALQWPGGEPAYAPHTVVDQAVAAMRRRAPGASGFVNAVLRRFLREREALTVAARRSPVAEWNHPAWWIDRLRADWPDCWAPLLRAANTRPPMTLRVNARRSSGRDYVDRLAAQGIGAALLGAQTVVLERPRPVQQLPGFAEGDVSVQDAAAQLAAPLLLGAAADRPGGSLRRGAHVLDACAAPGGKAAHLLEMAELDLLALDVDAARLARVQDTLTRLGLAARLAVGDARSPSGWWDGRPFDAILLDAPCTASGIVRRHPDVRWLRRPGDVEQLARTQAALLDALWPLLAPGGRLVYATCSIFAAEGRQQIDAFLQRLGPGAGLLSAASPGHLLPLADNSEAEAPAAQPDGFFYALIERT